MMKTKPPLSQNHSIKQQLEEILKSTKILCELEPFAKKWSIPEILPLTEDSSAEDISQILRDSKLESITDVKEREKVFREVKERMEKVGKSDLNNDNEPISHYDSELERTLDHIKEIELTDAVTPKDIENLRYGLCKPDGLDLDRTSLQEWKNIFLEQWLSLKRHEERCLQKHKGLLPYIVPSSSQKGNSVLKLSLEGHFTTRKGNYKNISDESRPSSPELVDKSKSLWSLKEQAHEKKRSSSAKDKMVIPALHMDEPLHHDYYHGERLRKCMIGKTSMMKVKANNDGKLKTKCTSQIQIRPSSAIPGKGVPQRKLKMRINQD